MRAHGYVLVETLVAMAVLSASMITIHNALGQAALTHAQARDLTQARFLLNAKMGEFRVNPALEEGDTAGDFGEAFSRFHWQARVSKVRLPEPPPPSIQEVAPIKLATPFLGKIVVTVQWTTRRQPSEERLETLVSPSHFRELPANAAARTN